MTTIRTTLVFEKSTKGAHRYQEVDDYGNIVEQHSSAVGTIYIRRSALPVPTGIITLSIETEDKT